MSDGGGGIDETMYGTVVNPADYEKQLELQRKQEEERNKPKEKKREENEFEREFIDEKSILIVPN